MEENADNIGDDKQTCAFSESTRALFFWKLQPMRAYGIVYQGCKLLQGKQPILITLFLVSIMLICLACFSLPLEAGIVQVSDTHDHASIDAAHLSCFSTLFSIFQRPRSLDRFGLFHFSRGG